MHFYSTSSKLILTGTFILASLTLKAQLAGRVINEQNEGIPNASIGKGKRHRDHRRQCRCVYPAGCTQDSLYRYHLFRKLRSQEYCCPEHRRLTHSKAGIDLSFGYDRSYLPQKERIVTGSSDCRFGYRRHQNCRSRSL